MLRHRSPVRTIGLTFRLCLLIGLAVATGHPARAACGLDQPGYRDAAGACVGWPQLEGRCGVPPETRCTPDEPDPAAARIVATPRGDPSLPACKGCGCKGGPGYRGPDGRCAGWKDLSRTCGTPLPGRCTAEGPAAEAGAVADQQDMIRARSHRKSP
ncbi:hypothetical protein [Prosthecodimorpha staleyi]|uniref:Uncharacterized protein n=1 Tax=Prosthecodimorpha staleyi TaxID=2840188 RepID=A0A947CZX9_9HYPH|nr:hypothetical protein [Prosthecodimorpha staleyi]MBT9288190.1 hypothetical protein [Prosthecodimorpha staleyi]